MNAQNVLRTVSAPPASAPYEVREAASPLPGANSNASVHPGPNRTAIVPLALTVDEAAKALNVSPKTIRRLLDRGILTASKALRKKLIPRSQIEGFLKATCETPKSIL